MCGWIKLNRDIIEADLWREVVPFRLYLLLQIRATRTEERMVNGIHLKRGQYIRAYSKLAEDLGYREGRGEKEYSKSTIKRAVDKLVKKQLITAEETIAGTLFTLVNCETVHSKGFSHFFCQSFNSTISERAENNHGTNSEQKQEREKKEEKIEKENDQTRANNPMSKKQTSRINAITERFLLLRNRGTALSAKDINAIENTAEMEVPLEKVLDWMNIIQANYVHKSPGSNISSMAYYKAAIGSRLKKSQQKIVRNETIQDRVNRLEKQGSLL